jgi:hypothetical protein
MSLRNTLLPSSGSMGRINIWASRQSARWARPFTCSVHSIILKMAAVCSSEMLVNFHQTAPRYCPFQLVQWDLHISQHLSLRFPHMKDCYKQYQSLLSPCSFIGRYNVSEEQTASIFWVWFCRWKQYVNLHLPQYRNSERQTSFLHHEHLKTGVISMVYISFSVCIQITVLGIHSGSMQS